MSRLVVASASLLGCSLALPLGDLEPRARDGGPTPEGAPVCADTQSSPQNCGACGHDCLGGTCTRGRCDPVAIASAQASPSSVAVDDRFVYWIAFSEIRRAPRDVADAGLPARVGGGGVGAASVLALYPPAGAADAVFAVESQASAAVVYRVSASEPPSGAKPAAVATYANGSNVGAFAFDGQRNYLELNGGGCTSKRCVLASSPDGQVPQQLIGVAFGSSFAFRAPTVFGYDDAVLFAVDASAAPRTVATLSGKINSIAVDDTTVYATVRDLGAVFAISADADAGAATPILSGQLYPSSIAARSGFIAWVSDEGLRGCVAARCKDTAQLYGIKAIASSIAIDDLAIYWTDPNRAGVFMVAR